MLPKLSKVLTAGATLLALADLASAQRTLAFVGCSMAENVAQGYVAQGGQRLWGPYGTGGMVVQSWTDANSQAWNLFRQQAQQHGVPEAVWVQICIFSGAGATFQEVSQIISIARENAAPGAEIYISGQPLYDGGQSCFLAGVGGPEMTDRLAQEIANDPAQNATYPGSFLLRVGEVSDGCHANQQGQASLGLQALEYFG